MATTDNKIINGSGLSKLSSQIKSYVNDKTEISVGATAPTDNKIKLWVDTSATGGVAWNDITGKPTNFDDWSFTATEETLDGTITLNKTFDEIKAAYQSGKNIICVFSSPRLESFGYSVSIMPLSFYGDTIICFSLSIAMDSTTATNGSLMITEDNTARFLQILVDTSQFITDSSLTEKGYQTADQVNTLINQALGVIENGTY